MTARELLQAMLDRVTDDYALECYGTIYGTGTITLTLKGDSYNVARFLEDIAYPQVVVSVSEEEG